MKKPHIWLAMAVTMAMSFEGLRLRTYDDMAGIPTICYGETRGVKRGMIKTKEECAEMLTARVQEFYGEIEHCLPVGLPETRKASFTVMAYNIGSTQFCKSSVARLASAGDTVGACNAMLKWNRVNGKEVAGLTRRRQAERDLCLQGAQ